MYHGWYRAYAPDRFDKPVFEFRSCPHHEMSNLSMGAYWSKMPCHCTRISRGVLFPRNSRVSKGVISVSNKSVWSVSYYNRFRGMCTSSDRPFVMLEWHDIGCRQTNRLIQLVLQTCTTHSYSDICLQYRITKRGKAINRARKWDCPRLVICYPVIKQIRQVTIPLFFNYS